MFTLYNNLNLLVYFIAMRNMLKTTFLNWKIFLKIYSAVT